MDKTDNFIVTYTGVRANVPVPQIEQMRIADIAHALSMQCRYTGHVKDFYSVAEHSVRATRLVSKKNKLAVLLHDASEAYLSDISRPMKVFMPEYRNLEARIQENVHKAFSVNGYDEAEVKRVDNIMLATEGRDLMPTTKGWLLTEPPLPKKICPWTHHNAEKAFLAIYRRLTNGQK